MYLVIHADTPPPRAPASLSLFANRFPAFVKEEKQKELNGRERERERERERDRERERERGGEREDGM